MNTAKIYLRKNSSFGSAYGTVTDTGHHIVEDSGRFTVWSIHNEDIQICTNASRQEAEDAIAADWDRREP